MDDSMKQKIMSLLDTHRIMTIATLRPDGWPLATTVGSPPSTSLAVWRVKKRRIWREMIGFQ